MAGDLAMTVADLIRELEKCPRDLEVFVHYDGAPRLRVDGAYGIESVKEWDFYQDIQISFNALVLCKTSDVEWDMRDEKNVWAFRNDKTKY